MTKIREGYKNTDIGIIPEDWEVKKLGNHTTLIDGDRGKNYPSTNEIVDDGILFLSTSNIKDNKLSLMTTKFITQEKFNKLNKGKLQQKDLIITLRGTLGSVMIFETDTYETAFINAQMMIIRPAELIDYKFLYQVMISNTVKSQISKNSSGSAQPQLTKKDVTNLKVPIPPFPEQQRIAEILSTTDEHIEKLDKTIEDYQLLKKGMMQSLLTDGIGHTEFKVTEIGRIPKEREIKRVGEVLNINIGGTPSRNNEEYWDVNKVGRNIWVSIRDLTSSGKYIDDSTEYISDMGVNKSNVKLIKPNTVIMSFKLTIGTVAITKVDLYTNEAIVAFETNEDVLIHQFLYYVLPTLHYETDSAIKGKTLNKQKINNAFISIPPIEEQKQIAEILSQIDNKIELYQHQKQDVIQLKKALMQQLLTGKIRTI